MITIVTGMEEEMDSDKAISFNRSFPKRLVELQVSKQLRQLSAMELYDKSFDPNDHFLKFESTLYYKGALASIVCRMFPLSLKSTVLKWFQLKPLRSIDLWLDLK